MNHPILRHIFAWAILGGISPAAADWREEIGFTRLQLIAAGELPTASASGLAQVEANEAGVNFKPDTTSPLFAGKTFTEKSGPSGVSGHATAVGGFFYASSSQLPGSGGVDLYSANGWLNANFLKSGSSDAPLVESRAVQNHSWIGAISASLTSAQAADIGRRLDFAIHRDGFVSVVGVNNDANNALPALLCQTYHTISVGRADGNHSAGFTSIDGPGRMKPDIVAPESATSWATPLVAGSSALLLETLENAYLISGPDSPRIVKALLLASATKDTVPAWNNAPGAPLDTVFGAGKLNVCLAYSILRAGLALSSNSTVYSPRGWAAQAVTNSATRTYFFEIPAGSPTTPFCAALTWHRIVNGDWGSVTTSTLRNLSLRLFHATNFTLGAEIAASTSAVDNVELIYRTALSPGRYALRVESAANQFPNQSTDFALAWHSLPAVTVSTTTATAREIDGRPGLISFNRTGDTALPLLVPITVSGSAISGSHFQPLPPDITFPAGQTTINLPVVPIADAIAQGGRSVIVGVGADFASAREPSQTALVSIEDKPADSWRWLRFTPSELADSAISGDTADPDGDGLPNLLEYALDFLPKSADPSPTPFIDVDGYLTISVGKNTAASDITWGAQVADDLTIWPSAVVTETPAIFTARDFLTRTAAERRFIRLRITRP